MLSNLRPQIVEEADRWERVVESGFRDLGLEKLVLEGMEQKSKLNHVDDPLLKKRHDRMRELKACLHKKEFGKPRRLVSAVDDSDNDDGDDGVPVSKSTTTTTKKKRKTKSSGKNRSLKPSSSTLSDTTTTTTKKKKKTSTKKVSFDPEIAQST